MNPLIFDSTVGRECFNEMGQDSDTPAAIAE